MADSDAGALRWWLNQQKKMLLDPWNYVAICIFFVVYVAGWNINPSYTAGVAVGIVLAFVGEHLPRRDRYNERGENDEC